MRIPLILSLLTLTGCSGGDPETSRLRAGRECLATYGAPPPEELKGYARAIPLIVDMAGEESSLWPTVEPGTRILVIEDAEKGEDNPTRLVGVKVEDGDLAGRSGKMVRGSLRPVE